MRVLLDGVYFGEWGGTLEEYLSVIESMGDTDITLERLSWEPSEHRASLFAKIAERRYKEETRGIVVNGILINTERDSQNLINGAVVSCLLDPTYVCNWKTPSGFIPLDADTLKAVGLAVRAHVQACFDREGELHDLVDAGTFTEDDLSEGWPA